jgi:hypothetical protein
MAYRRAADKRKVGTDWVMNGYASRFSTDWKFDWVQV